MGTCRGWVRRKITLMALAALVVGAACSDLVPPPTPYPRVGTLLPISGSSPFEGCSHKGEITFDSEVEPSLAVDPRTSSHLIATWQQDRNLHGGALGILTASSTDGGQSWQTAKPPISSCAGGTYDLASDPVVAIGPDRAYLAAIGIAVIGTEAQLALDDEVIVSVSTDGGSSWGKPVVVVTSNDPLISFDKETLVADPTASGTAYALWVRYTQPAGDEPAQTNATFMARTTDGGITWSTPTLVYEGSSETQFHQLVVLPDGSLIDVFIEAPTLSKRPPLPARLAVVRSADRGMTWSAATTAANVSFTAVRDPTGKDQVRGTGQGILAAGAPDGSLYVCWSEQHAGGTSFLDVVRSTNGGRTWSAPSRVVSTGSGQPFVPQIAVAGDGRVGVTWYQITGAGEDGQLQTEAWLAWSGDRGKAWQSLRLAGPFDLHTAKLTDGGDFVGDYEGLVGLPRGFAAANALAGPISRSGATDVFFSSVDLGPSS
jgi:hypothetical protein